MSSTSGLAGLVIFFLIAAIIERIVEVTFGSWQVKPDDKKEQRKKIFLTLFAASALGIAICWFGKLNIFIPLGIEVASDPTRQVLYYILTGISVGSGTQFLHEWIAIAVRTKETLKKNMEGKDNASSSKKNSIQNSITDTSKNTGNSTDGC